MKQISNGLKKIRAMFQFEVSGAWSTLKFAQVLTLFVVTMLVVMPLAAGAQFQTPDAGGTGLPNQRTASELILRIINILLAIAGLIAVLFLVIGGFRYITSGGNEEIAGNAKKIILNAVIGIVVIILSFVIVRVVANALLANGQI